MSTKSKLSNLGVLEKYRNALTNAESQPDIAVRMAERGYTQEELEKGKTLLTQTQASYYRSLSERDEMRAARMIFQRQWQMFKHKSSIHRNIANVAFRKDEIAAAKLSVDGPAPKTYLKWIDAARKFYTKALATEEYLKRLAILKLPEDELRESLKMIDNLEALKSTYMKEKGQSENATDAKRKAFQQINDWMGDFFAVAKIAFLDEPQLQEALGKVVRS